MTQFLFKISLAFSGNLVRPRVTDSGFALINLAFPELTFTIRVNTSDDISSDEQFEYDPEMDMRTVGKFLYFLGAFSIQNYLLCVLKFGDTIISYF